MPRKMDISGQRFGRWTAVKFAGLKRSPKSVKSLWLCHCDCGEVREIEIGTLTNGTSKSCGCLKRELVGTQMKGNTYGITHGYSKMVEHSAWYDMIRRCTDPSRKSYKSYGGRGIKVCKRWLKFENFLEDMGERPEGTTLERKNNERGYCRGNCKWATKLEQANNTRVTLWITFKGRTQTLPQWSREVHIRYHTLWGRLKLGWSIERILTTPIRKRL